MGVCQLSDWSPPGLKTSSYMFYCHVYVYPGACVRILWALLYHPSHWDLMLQGTVKHDLVYWIKLFFNQIIFLEHIPPFINMQTGPTEPKDFPVNQAFFLSLNIWFLWAEAILSDQRIALKTLLLSFHSMRPMKAFTEDTLLYSHQFSTMKCGNNIYVACLCYPMTQQQSVHAVMMPCDCSIDEKLLHVHLVLTLF